MILEVSQTFILDRPSRIEEIEAVSWNRSGCNQSETINNTPQNKDISENCSYIHFANSRNRSQGKENTYIKKNKKL